MTKKEKVKSLVTLSENIKKILETDDRIYIERAKKTHTIDGFAFKLLYGQKNISQDTCTAKLNDFLGNDTKKKKIGRSSLVDRENQLDINIYKKIYTEIDEYIKENYNKDKNIVQVYAVDGTDVHLSNNLKKEGYKQNKSGNLINAQIMGIYNVTYNHPIVLDLVKHKNERKAFKDYIADIETYRGSIFIYDRGYWSSDLSNTLENKGIKYIMRIKDNSSLITSDSHDITTILNEKDVRIITYIINEKKYHVATNLMDKKEYNIEIIKQMYHDRWKIEEFFKYIKSCMKLGTMNEQSEISLMKTIYAQLIVARLIDLIISIKGPHKKSENMIINKTTLTKGMYDNFILRFIYNKTMSCTSINSFILIYAIYTKTRKGEHYERASNKPFTKWYIKRYFKIYKLKEIAENKTKNKTENIKT